MTAPLIVISRCDPEHLDARQLVEELSATLAGITGDSGKASFTPEDARLPRSLFVVARDVHGQLLGCGALRPLEGESETDATAELKRMYARPGTQGVGAALLDYLECSAREFGYARLWLETRRVNARAVEFYVRHGYAPIANFGKYVGRADAICLGKALA
jgi:GNAT superfamily N-acetyltransferase